MNHGVASPHVCMPLSEPRRSTRSQESSAAVGGRRRLEGKSPQGRQLAIGVEVNALVEVGHAVWDRRRLLLHAAPRSMASLVRGASMPAAASTTRRRFSLQSRLVRVHAVLPRCRFAAGVASSSCSVARFVSSPPSPSDVGRMADSFGRRIAPDGLDGMDSPDRPGSLWMRHGRGHRGRAHAFTQNIRWQVQGW